jgi:hypothetical protein
MDNPEAAREWIANRRTTENRGGKRDRGSTGGQLQSLREQLLAVQVRKTEAEAELKELESSIQAENLVSMDEARAAIAEVMGPLRVLLDSLPKACAIKCNPADPQLAEDSIREAVDSIYKAMDRVKETGANAV